MRGLNLLKEEGILTYSTCSLNPIENEAVVSAALLQSKGEMELVDCRHILGDFKTRKGLTSWKVCDDVEFQLKR
jgi:16S rRNA C967 or C1407 C5-methylase (RsmB/RsmF family)